MEGTRAGAGAGALRCACAGIDQTEKTALSGAVFLYRPLFQPLVSIMYIWITMSGENVNGTQP
ncbi:hypothetical protein R69619_05915 [Paraburkholderia nemoris]|nr:hypothetical protein R69619_05915 [Paraburkholderia nemoris]